MKLLNILLNKKESVKIGDYEIKRYKGYNSFIITDIIKYIEFDLSKNKGYKLGSCKDNKEYNNSCKAFKWFITSNYQEYIVNYRYTKRYARIRQAKDNKLLIEVEKGAIYILNINDIKNNKVVLSRNIKKRYHNESSKTWIKSMF